MTNALKVKTTEAAEIGELYRRSAKRLLESINDRLECGRRLNAIKERLPKGTLEVWLDDNNKALGFGRSTAFRLMGAAARVASTRLTDENEALELSRSLWGNETRSKQVTDALNAADAAYRAERAARSERFVIRQAPTVTVPHTGVKFVVGRNALPTGNNIERINGIGKYGDGLKRTADDDSDVSTPEMTWRRGLLFRAQESATNAEYEHEDWSGYVADDELIAACEKAAEDWAKCAAYVKSLAKKDSAA